MNTRSVVGHLVRMASSGIASSSSEISPMVASLGRMDHPGLCSGAKTGVALNAHQEPAMLRNTLMRNFGPAAPVLPHKPVPRGIATSGPAILSYGFRPFFLSAGIYAMLAMVLWIGALSGLWPIGGAEGPVAWHAHEMLFGYASAALAGFILTAVPNWTGKLPVSGRPLALLLGLWFAGRCVSLAPAVLGDLASALVDALFLPVLAAVVAREVIAGRNWQNLRIAGGISLLAVLNIAFHATVLSGGDPAWVLRATVALYVLLIAIVGGRIVPSFTRNYLARRAAARLPTPMGRLDQVALAAALVAGMAWTVAPEGWATALLCLLTASLHAVRLARWRGTGTWREPLLLILHVGYAFVAIGYLAVGFSALGLLSAASALHLLTVGAIAVMTLAVMTRASRGHTGRPLTALRLTTTSYACLVAVALLRPLAEQLPDYSQAILSVSALAWIAAFGLFVLEHAPILLGPSVGKAAAARASRD
jgi:uncharacterized protein involved in response to NO